MPIIFVMQGKCFLKDISRPAYDSLIILICYGFKTIQNGDPNLLDYISFSNFDGSNAISQSQHAPGLNFSKVGKLGDNSIQNFHLVRYIIVYMVGNLVLRRCINSFPTMYLTI